ncbi:MAG TPA: hypothetical protein PKJ41_09955 [Bryobacteraceae bacterium]|nr:hypothetical protein [Bryobacteraceae bacterium]HPT27000.1 hypothetical protein [Bryobacteraceae bacterium]
MATRSSVQESLGALRAAADEDLTAAICELHTVRRAFNAAIAELTVRTGFLETGLAEVERATPLLLPFDEPAECGHQVRAIWVKILWAAVAVLCLAALAGGFLAGRAWGR